MSKKQKKTLEPFLSDEIQKMVNELIETAQDVVEDYTDNPSEMTGSFHYVHGDSPRLKHQELKDRINREGSHDN